jgi:hypothetical protein
MRFRDVKIGETGAEGPRYSFAGRMGTIECREGLFLSDSTLFEGFTL